MITRRTLVSLPAAAVFANPSWDDRLGVMCQLGATEASARKVLEAAREAGFRRVMVNFAWDHVDAGFRRALPGWIVSHDVRCEALGAYVNCVSPETVLMSTRASDFEYAIRYAGELHCARLVAWTGSHVANLMKSDPRNFTEESEDALVRFLEPHLKVLERNQLTLALETYVTLTCPDAGSLRRVLDRLPGCVGAVLDPPNLTPPGRYKRRDEELRAMVKVLAGRIALVHLKDFRLNPDGASYDLPGPMAGEMNYRLFVSRIRTLPQDVPVIAEHIGPDEFRPTRQKLLPLFTS
jgi:sugar phosphate isomerase/epimerase